MKFVDLVSRFGDVTLRTTPIRPPWDKETTQPAWDIQLSGPDIDVSGTYVEDPGAAQTLIEYGEELFGDEYDEDAEPERRDPREIARGPKKKIGTPEQYLQ